MYTHYTLCIYGDAPVFGMNLYSWAGHPEAGQVATNGALCHKWTEVSDTRTCGNRKPPHQTNLTWSSCRTPPALSCEHQLPKETFKHYESLPALALHSSVSRMQIRDDTLPACGDERAHYLTSPAFKCPWRRQLQVKPQPQACPATHSQRSLSHGSPVTHPQHLGKSCDLMKWKFSSSYSTSTVVFKFHSVSCSVLLHGLRALMRVKVQPRAQSPGCEAQPHQASLVPLSY